LAVNFVEKRGRKMAQKKTFARKFQDLLVYRRTLDLAREIFQISITFPKEEVYSLTSQIRRSSRSIGAQIAEAWGKRSYIKHFSSKLTDAISEIYETEHWLEIAEDCDYISSETKNLLCEKYNEVSRMIASMIRKVDHFCS
jgi:four helix bundle protein